MQPNYYLKDDDVNIAVYDNQQQSNSTILFVHGNSLSGAVFKQQFTDEKLNSFRLISFDLPGHGKSDKAKNPEETYTFQSLVKTVETIFNHLHINNCIVAGFSLRAHLIMQNSGSKDNFKGAFLFGYPPVSQLSDLMTCGHPGPALQLAFKGELTNEEVDIIVNEFLNGNKMGSSEITSFIKQTDPAFRSTMITSVAGASLLNEVEIIESFSNPIALVHLENDKFVRYDYLQSKNIRNLWKNNIQQIKSAGHSGFIEKSKDFNSLLFDYAIEIF